jgi:Esterase/lipase
MSIHIKLSLLCSVLLSFVTFSSCNNDSTISKTKDSATSLNSSDVHLASDLKPVQPKPAWGKDLSDPMAVVIEKIKSFNSPTFTSLSAQEARKQPSPADAAMAVLNENKLPISPNYVDTIGKDIQVTGGQIHLRIYTPKTGKNIYPVIVYYHGGGWVIANLDTYNSSAQALSNLVEAVVISVAYRQAPENKFPTAHMDSYAAYEWILKNAASLKGDTKRIALVGESAGGNLAAAVSMMARDKGLIMPVYEVLVYPIAGYDFYTDSYKESDSTKPLSSGLMKWFFDKYLNNASEGKSSMISLVNSNFKGMPPTTIIAAKYDPLRSEGEALAKKFKKADVPTDYNLYAGTTHEFFGMADVVPQAKDAQELAASKLKYAFNNK